MGNYVQYQSVEGTHLHALLADMVARGASDMHVTSELGPVRYRVDGDLTDEGAQAADLMGVLGDLFGHENLEAELFLLALQGGLDFDAALNATIETATGPQKCRFRLTCSRDSSGSRRLSVRAIPANLQQGIFGD